MSTALSLVAVALFIAIAATIIGLAVWWAEQDDDDDNEED